MYTRNTQQQKCQIERENYTIFFSGRNESDKSKSLQNKPIRGGVAIAIKTQLKNNITKIKRYSSRSIEIQIKTTKYTNREYYKYICA